MNVEQSGYVTGGGEAEGGRGGEIFYTVVSHTVFAGLLRLPCWPTVGAEGGSVQSGLWAGESMAQVQLGSVHFSGFYTSGLI